MEYKLKLLAVAQEKKKKSFFKGSNRFSVFFDIIQPRIPGLESRDDAGRKLQPVVRCLFCCPPRHTLRNPPAGTGSLASVGSTVERQHLGTTSNYLWMTTFSINWWPDPARPPPMASRSRVKNTVGD